MTELTDLLRTLLSRRWFILGAAAAGTLLALAASFLVTPIFRGESVVVIDGDDADRGLAGLVGELGGLASLAGVNLGGMSAGADEVLAYLQGREMGMKFIREQGLADAIIKAPHLRGVLSGREALTEDQKSREAYRLFASEVRSVQFDKKAGVTRIIMDWPDPDVAADWANSYVALADAALRKRALDGYQGRREFLEKELETTNQVDLRNAVAKLLDSQLRLAMVANSRGEFALKTIDPAVPALPRDRISPRRAVYATFGFLAGLSIAGLMVLLRRPSQA